ncbi:LAFE_0E11210g1_1 [Lachancea fermentati]|uniref:LAFE_0E11210g1_1 n=1 Tax=Lachancea fermentati TaxID=4955 RepID=A0A1G4MDK5_LACFM|nr:LAFE_0E11210g1_1 [Lachancea fermentati]
MVLAAGARPGTGRACAHASLLACDNAVAFARPLCVRASAAIRGTRAIRPCIRPRAPSRPRRLADRAALSHAQGTPTHTNRRHVSCPVACALSGLRSRSAHAAQIRACPAAERTTQVAELLQAPRPLSRWRWACAWILKQGKGFFFFCLTA